MVAKRGHFIDDPGGFSFQDEVFQPELPDYPKLSRLPASQLPEQKDLIIAIAGEGALIPEAYGKVVIPRPRIFAAGQHFTSIVMGLLWCRGEVDAVEGVYVGDNLVSTIDDYTGDAGNDVNNYLAAAISGYADTMPGLCYSVVRLSGDDIATAPTMRAVVRGRKIYDPRTTTTVYSTNFALMFRDLAVARGLTVDETNISTAADFCDELVPLVTGEKRRWGGLFFDKPETIDKQLALMAEYAGCFYVREAGTVKLIPDAPASSIFTFDDTSTDNIVEGSLKLTKRSLSQSPNQSIVEYQDTSKWPWRTGYAETTTPSGDIRSTTYRMPGYQSYAVANRQAIERQNRFNLSDLEVSFEAFDESLKVEQGDIITVTHNVGITSKLFRVMGVRASRFAGSWIIQGEEYDPLIYSDSVETDPSYPDTDLPSPSIVPTPNNYTVISEIEQDEVGVWNAHVLATWDALGDAYPFAHTFEVSLVLTDNTLIDTRANITGTSARVGPLLPSNGNHHVRLKVIGSTGVESATLSLQIAIAEKASPPTDVPAFLARGVGAELRASWNASTDESSIRHYELRYGAVAVTWAASTLLTRVDALSLLTKELATGTYDILIKAIDNTGVYSTNEARVSGVVIVSGSATLQADWATDTNMFLLNDGTWVTDSGETWNALFPNAMNTYTSALYSYQTTTSDWTSEELDPALGAISAQWLATATYTDIAGTAVEELELYYSAVWNAEGVVSITKTAEKSRYLITGSSGDVFIITPPVALSMDS